MSGLVKEIVEQINIDKEVIQVSPKTGIKAIRQLLKNLEEMQEKYNAIYDATMKEIKLRYDRINSIAENEEIEKVQNEILELDNLVLSEAGQTSFEKMELDKLCYHLNGFYKKNLYVINKAIYECVKKFREVGISVTSKDFNISEYANEYMTVLLEEADNGRINSDKVKDAFENVYWKCSNLISPHIVMNIRQIYDQNESNIDKYYKNKTEEVLSSLNVTQKQVEKRKEDLIKKLNDLKGVDGRLILDSFLNNTYSITDYKDERYKLTYENLISKKLNELSLEQKQEMDSNIERLHTNLVEYKTYLDFRFISNDLLELKNQKAKEVEKEKADKKNKKSEYETIQADIKKLAAEIKKDNAELQSNEKPKFPFIFKKKINKKATEKILERDNKILQLKSLYEKLDNSKLKEKINTNLDDSSKILDVFKLASYYYEFLARSIIKEVPDIVENDIDSMIERFRKFVRLYDFSVINHINITEKKELSIVIKDKYKLLGLTLSKENFSDENLEDLISQIQIIDYYNHIKNSNIPIEDIQYEINAKAILKE